MGTYVLVFIVVVVLLISIASRRSETKLRRMEKEGILSGEGQESEAEVDRLIQMGRKIDAIKVYRKLNNVDLKEAKEAVEKRKSEIGVR